MTALDHAAAFVAGVVLGFLAGVVAVSLLVSLGLLWVLRWQRNRETR